MARNQEKAQAMLNRFLVDQKGQPATKAKRPHLASECADLNEADRWRQQILRDIGRKVMEIQNASLGEHRIRDLNDEINKLIREKGHWERRIVELGGPDYAKGAPKVTADDDGDGAGGDGGAATTTGGGGGYRYFGAAKQLPGVKELFERPAARSTARRTRAQLAKGIGPDYYGFRDEEDGVLLRLERAAERGAYGAALQRAWEAGQGGQQQQKRAREEADAAAAGGGRAGGEGGAAAAAADGGGEEGGGGSFAAFVPLPDRAAIERAVVAKKKRELLARYATDGALAQQAETASMLLNQK